MYFRSQRKTAGDLSLSDTLDTDGEGSNLSILDVLSQDDDQLEKVDVMEACSHLRACIEENLTPREARVIRLRYGLDASEPLSQREVAANCGISRSYVSRIEKRALEKLREAFGEA